MEDGASFLFTGTSFNKKKYTSEIARFKEKKETENKFDYLSSFERANPDSEEATVSTKKRKRKQGASEAVEGFNVFKSSIKASADSILRKKYNIHVSGNNVATPLKSFAELSSVYGCESYLLQNFAKLEFKEPTPIQRQAIPILFYLLSRPRMLCLCSNWIWKNLGFCITHANETQAAQTTREGKKLAEYNKFYIKLLTKKLIRSGDLSKLHCDILISTPLRLRSAIKKKKLDLSRVEYLVLDESAKLFELGLIKQIDAVVKACSNPSIICSLFSATLPDSVEELARTIMHDAVQVIIG
ncbi:DEAD-box ATP-dependent RNA helicase 57-like [Hibiscus syriacus]|uniref:DEAD-box ATP-dependent RNA helicase 57-like n=1 Tax=Hibiscus syriacus TaxID=106335 RepID=UPI001924AA8D|nr:DEAD-box ATP-dependent RNA helicase 57-like [Hibiscus syriacus]